MPQDKVDGMIRKLPNSPYWTVKTSDEYGKLDERYFVFAASAFDYWRRFELEAYCRIRARKLYGHINLISIENKERIFIDRMLRRNFTGMTKKQYCYFVGIQERNPY